MYNIHLTDGKTRIKRTAPDLHAAVLEMCGLMIGRPNASATIIGAVSGDIYVTIDEGGIEVLGTELWYVEADDVETA